MNRQGSIFGLLLRARGRSAENIGRWHGLQVVLKFLCVIGVVFCLSFSFSLYSVYERHQLFLVFIGLFFNFFV